MIPRLIHPIPIKIERLDRSTTIYDEDAREPVQHAKRRSYVTVPGQVRWISASEVNLMASGIADEARGYVIFRKVDLDAKGFMIQLEDRMIMVGNVTEEVYVIRIEPMAHYPDQGGATMFRAWFSDRAPAKGRGVPD